MGLNDNRTLRVVMKPDDRRWVAAQNGKIAALESLPGIMESKFMRLSPGETLGLADWPSDREILILEGGVDAGGRRWGKGAYLRLSGAMEISLAAGEDGALLFAKTGQFPEKDSESRGIDTAQGSWSPGLVEGLSVLPLYSGGTANTALVRWEPGTVFQPHSHFGGEEILVLSGTFEDEHGAYPSGSWIRSPHMSRHSPYSKEGCLIFVKTGHLRADSSG